jgi:hypothetical protein
MGYYDISSDFEGYLTTNLKLLEKDLKHKPQLVREVIFNIIFSAAFAEKFCMLFLNLQA